MRPDLSKIFFHIAPDLIHQELPAYIKRPVKTLVQDQLGLYPPCTQPWTVPRVHHPTHPITISPEPSDSILVARYCILDTQYRVLDRALGTGSTLYKGDTILCGKP